MTSFEPPKKQAFDDAELALAIESAADALAAMEILETQSRLRAADAEAYVAWVRQMEADGSDQAKSALNAARRQSAGIKAEEPLEAAKSESNWQALVPDWEERQEATARAAEEAVVNARARAEAEAAEQLRNAVAEAIAQAQDEAERAREAAVEQVRAEAAAKLAEEIEAARVIALEQAQREAEEAKIEAAELLRVQKIEEAEEEVKLAAQQIEDISEPEPQRAAGFATGSFDIVASAEQEASEENDEFDYLLSDGELPFAKEPRSKKLERPITTIERRAKPISQLFIWGGLTVGMAPLMLAAYVSQLKNAGDGIIAIALGLLFSSAIISVAAIAGKRSGLSTLILSRAAFGVKGNLVSAIPLVIMKLVFGAVVFSGAVATFNGTIASAPDFSDAPTSFPGFNYALIGLAALLLVGGVLAFFGGRVLYWAQVAAAGIGAIAVISFVAATAGSLRFEVLVFSSSPDFLALVAVSAVVGVLFGAFWITAVAEFTRKLPMRVSGKRVSLFVALATGVLPLLISSYGLLVFKSVLKDYEPAQFLSPLNEVLHVLPAWAGNIALYSAIITLLIWVASWMYATSVSFASIGAKLHPGISQPVILVITLLLTYFALQFVSASVIAVVILAWAGIFVGDVARRRIAYHEVSLVSDYGFYKAWNWVNITGFVLAIALGLGLVSNVEGIYSWLGFISDDYQMLGVYVAPLFSFLFPIIFGASRIKAQETEVLKVEARRNDLDNVEVA